MDPLEIPFLTIKAGNRAVAFEQNYKNVKVRGYNQAICPNAK